MAAFDEDAYVWRDECGPTKRTAAAGEARPLDGPQRLQSTFCYYVRCGTCYDLRLWLYQLPHEGQPYHCSFDFRNYILDSKSSRLGPPLRHCYSHIPCLPYAYLIIETDPFEQYNPVRQEYFVSQTGGLVDRVLYLGPYNRSLEQLCAISR